ncbi:DUF1259 domain-containing protein [Fimbriimonas ginsengisoli]|uniref:DUF1259 domain-containing protein n=1 Tax=Fimbriimonas ginsengisoli Gsoil 348 TaxID=661478 RepID=A0A068NJU4_FIMGI|nr:DUF1259 domain-containing protein [Fimbriimonas ginsengisoli]AIE83776.1 hypothetical protein OP10G_0408 [Fimbriimonas ginsengisoli Gsoil 348]
MDKYSISRRHLIRAGTALGAASAFGLGIAEARLQEPVKKATPPLTATEIAAIDAALGKKGAYNEAQATHVVALPRNDLQVVVRGEAVPIPLGFGGWAAFKNMQEGGKAVFMSDNVLTEEEINPLIDSVEANGLEVGAIHNHFIYEQPRIFFMHVHGTGSPEDLAQRYAKAISTTKISPANQPKPNPPSKTAKEIFDLPGLDAIVGKTGVVNGPAYKYTVGRSDLHITEMGAEMTAAIGLNTWATFVGTPDKAMVAGDVAMLGHEVNPVIRHLRSSGVEVCAVHSHMLAEQPRILFLHYLGRGKAKELAEIFRGVLDLLGNVPRSTHGF